MNNKERRERLRHIQEKLAEAEKKFEEAGGRGVELADEIDRLRQEEALQTFLLEPLTKARVRRALQAVVDYNWDKEEADWRSGGTDFALLKDHVFGQLIILQEFLNRGKYDR